MPSASPSDVKFEIGHVLFIDIVGYSKLLISEQSAQLALPPAVCARAVIPGQRRLLLVGYKYGKNGHSDYVKVILQT